MTLSPSYPLPFPPITGYETIKKRIQESGQGFTSTYDRTFARNDVLLALVEQLETDILELKKRERTRQSFPQPLARTGGWNQIAPYQRSL